MTQMRKIFFAILIAGSLVFTGCSLSQMAKLATDQQLTVTPNPLEVHADTVSYEMSAVLPVKMLKKGKVYTVNNFYSYGDQELALEGVEFKADDYPDAATSQPNESKTFSFAYDPAMKKGELKIGDKVENIIKSIAPKFHKKRSNCSACRRRKARLNKI